MRHGKNHNKKCLERYRRAFTRTNFLVYPCASSTRAERLPPGGSLGTPKILGTGATLNLVPVCLHDKNWECRALKSSARCQKFGVPCRFLTRVNRVWEVTFYSETHDKETNLNCLKQVRNQLLIKPSLHPSVDVWAAVESFPDLSLLSGPPGLLLLLL